MKATKTIRDGIVFLLILLFVYAAVFKLLDFKNFKHYIDLYSPFGKYISGTMALGIPLVEICVACLLFLPRYTLIGLYASLMLMVGFTIYIGYYVISNTPHRPCLCGGILNNMGWTEHLFFNIAFTALVLVGILVHSRQIRNKYITSNSI